MAFGRWSQYSLPITRLRYVHIYLRDASTLIYDNLSGADNVIEVAVVLPNATIAIANEHCNPDLFW
jgi:hypothetical protein